MHQYTIFYSQVMQSPPSVHPSVCPPAIFSLSSETTDRWPWTFACEEVMTIVLRGLKVKVIGHRSSSHSQHPSYDVCLEVRWGIIRTVQCCIMSWNCTQSSTLRRAILTVVWIRFCHTGLISLCTDLFVFICVYFVCFCFLMHIMLCCYEHGGLDLMWLKPTS